MAWISTEPKVADGAVIPKTPTFWAGIRERETGVFVAVPSGGLIATDLHDWLDTFVQDDDDQFELVIGVEKEVAS